MYFFRLVFFLIASHLLLQAQPVITELLNPAHENAGFAPGEVIIVRGSGLASETRIALAPPLPKTLAGTSVTIDGTPCSLLLVAPDTIYAQLPHEITSSRSSYWVDIVVKTGEGEATVGGPLGRTAPGLVTEARDGKGKAVVLDENLRPVRAPKEGDVVILQAMGLGDTDPPATAGLAASATEPFFRVKAPVEVFVGDAKAEVLFAGLSPMLAGIYQLKIVVPQGAGSTVRLVADSREHTAGWPRVQEGEKVTEVSGTIEPVGNATFATGWSPIYIGAKFVAAMTILPGADPFSVELENEVAKIGITVKPGEGTFEGRAVVPTVPTRSGDFSNTNLGAIDLLAGGLPMPGNIVPRSRMSPQVAMALGSMVMPNEAASGGSANAGFSFKGTIPADGRLILNETTLPGGTTAAGWLPVAATVKNHTTAFRLLVAGKEVAQREVVIPVQ